MTDAPTSGRQGSPIAKRMNRWIVQEEGRISEKKPVTIPVAPTYKNPLEASAINFVWGAVKKLGWFEVKNETLGNVTSETFYAPGHVPFVDKPGLMA